MKYTKNIRTSNKMVKCNMRKWNKYMERAPLPWRSTGENIIYSGELEDCGFQNLNTFYNLRICRHLAKI